MPRYPINYNKMVLYRIYDRRNNLTYKIHYTTNFNQKRKQFKLDVKKNKSVLYSHIRRDGPDHYAIEEIKKVPCNNITELENEVYLYRGGLHLLT